MKVTRVLKLTTLLALAPCVLLAAHARAAPAQDAGLSPDQLRNQAVQYARRGDYLPAIDGLERILASDPDNLPAYHDLLVILGWAEQDEKVLRLAEQLDPATAPLWVINALGKSARNVGDFAKSVHWYTLAVIRAPADLDSNLGRALALADLGQHAPALAVLAALPDEVQETPNVQMAEGYIHHSAGNYTQALLAFDRILGDAPDHRDALRGKVLALRRLQLPAEALAIAAEYPELFDHDELARLRTDWAAMQIRQASQTATPKSITDRSIEHALSTMASTAEQFADDDIVQQRTHFDRVVAYRSQHDWAAAITEFEGLDTAPLDIPVYVLAAAAGAYLHLRQPEEAEALLLQALLEEPGSFRLQQDLFWVYVDLERQAEALALAEEMRRNQPMWLEEPGSRVFRGNPRRLQSEIMVGLALSFLDQLPEAQAQFEQLLAIAPNNTSLQQELATILRRRGWTERAMFEYQQALAVEPDLVAAAAGNTHALLDQREFERGKERIDTLLTDLPEHPDTRRLTERWARINQYRYRIDSSFGNSTGDQFGSTQYTVDGYFFMKPLAYRFRPFIHSTDAFAEFPEGDASRRRLGAGVEYRSVAWTGSLELHGDRDGGGAAGVTGIAEWLHDDTWSVAANVETQSAAVPLRGHRLGLDANRFGLRLAYRASELRRVSMSADQTRISDGNTVNSWSLQGRQRVYARPAYKLDLDAGLFTSNSDKQDADYFNPGSATALLLTAINEWRTYRRYDFSFSQQLNVEFGIYRQSSQGNNPIGSVSYRGNVDINKGLSVNFGMQYGRRVYDGNSEYLTFFSLGVAGLF